MVRARACACACAHVAINSQLSCLPSLIFPDVILVIYVDLRKL